ncbi:hypothetical protein D6745_00770 [Candidatus Woesearchaeota archaeon]|nr:MAG: hypothetical protein D6745_00770 [Candidatus Woesearchaeota archaeon]
MKEFERKFINFIVGVYRAFGMDMLSSKLLAILYLEPNEIPMEKLAKMTGYSLASVSNKMRLFEGTNTVQRIKKPGTKRVFYYMEKDFCRLMENKFKAFYEKEILPSKKFVPQLLKENRGINLNNEEKEKMRIIKNYYKQMLMIEKALRNINFHLKKMKK